MNFAITGVAGYIAPRHLKAIQDTGNRLVAAADPHDAVGILDRFAFDVRYFTEIERFDRHLEKLRRGPAEQRVGADAICEKPLVINSWNLDPLQEIEKETGRRVRTVLQLRVHPELVTLRERLVAQRGARRQVSMTYITSRGQWYDVSWKGREDRSGGIVTNIGIHFFDLLIWLFGGVRASEVHLREAHRAAGYLDLDHADVQWFLSTESTDLPFAPVAGGRGTFRSISVDGTEVEFSEGFTDLHTRIYQEVLSGGGFGIDDARPSIELTSTIRAAAVKVGSSRAHPKAAVNG
jgi:UDP-N-acetyl-2-amino-2-deoxyglucuronate dehydrogenase